MAGDDERMSQIETRVITPMDAAKILGKNYEKNRNIRQSVVKRYANDMRSGRWSTDACPPIVIAKDGSLIDGQHRLSAVMQAGVAVIMDVKTGVDLKACFIKSFAASEITGEPSSSKNFVLPFITLFSSSALLDRRNIFFISS